MSTGVSTKHPTFQRNSFLWRSVRDALEGMNAVKRANEIYLPMPTGFLQDDTSASVTPAQIKKNKSNETIDYIKTNTPYYHDNPAYMGYLQRARFPEITMNTLRGLLGVVQRKELSISLPPNINYLESKATKKGHSLEELFWICLSEVLSEGRITLVVDVDPETNKAHLVPYKTEAFINWDDCDCSGENKLAVFEEKTLVFKDKDEFEQKEEVTHLVYKKMIVEDEDSVFYKQEVVVARKFLDNEEIEELRSVPNLQGTPFESNPVVTIGSIENKNNPSPIPLLGISEIAYSVYQKNADLRNAQYMTCNPMFVITGAQNDDGLPVQFGSTAALLISNPDAKAFFPETDTSALDHVSQSTKDDFEEAANYGASLLGPAKKGVESADTAKIRQSAQGATLVSAVENTCKGLHDAIAIIEKLNGTEIENAKNVIECPTDFAELVLGADMIKALVFSWQAGVYSKESLVGMFLEAGFAEGEVDDEIARIFGEGPNQNSNIEDEDFDKNNPLEDEENNSQKQNEDES